MSMSSKTAKLLIEYFATVGIGIHLIAILYLIIQSFK